jgi:hypothetical protein
MKTRIVRLRKSIMNSGVRTVLIMNAILFVCFGFPPTAQAVSPPPDGGYGGQNTAEGTNALFNLTTGIWNSAFGFRALYKNTAGIRNTAIGYEALYNTNGTFNVNGRDNVAVGPSALFSNTTGSRNIAIGSFALQHNTTGSDNIAIGNRALWELEGASGVTAIGDSFYSDPDDVEVGRRRTCNTDIVATARINAYNIFIGHPAFFGDAPESCTSPTNATQSVHIVVDETVPGSGAVFVGGVYNNPIVGSPVAIDSNGKLGVQASSARFKDEIKSIGKASEAVLSLKPVTFRYKKEVDPKRGAEFGLLAEDVEKVDPDLIVRDKDGKPYSVRYEAVNAMLLNEFLKAHRKIEEQNDAITDLKSEMKAVNAALKQQATEMQAMRAQLKMGKAAPQVVANP